MTISQVSKLTPTHNELSNAIRILTADADLILYSTLTMSDGQLTSTGGKLQLAHGQTSKFSGNALMMLDNTILSSDNETSIALIEIDGEPNLSMTDDSQILNITLSTTEDTVGTISTSGGVNCTLNCTGFTETGAYGFNSHGLYRNVTSANWVLSESDGDRKTATMSVKLLSRPSSDVVVVLSSSDLTEATLDTYSLSFTPSTSQTALTAPPAIIPVPFGAALNFILPAPSFP